MRNAEGLSTIDGMEYLASVPKGETIVGMTVFDGTIFVATDKHIYTLEDGKRLELVAHE